MQFLVLAIFWSKYRCREFSIISPLCHLQLPCRILKMYRGAISDWLKTVQFRKYFVARWWHLSNILLSYITMQIGTIGWIPKSIPMYYQYNDDDISCNFWPSDLLIIHLEYSERKSFIFFHNLLRVIKHR